MRQSTASAVVTFFAVSSAAYAADISELRIDQPGVDTDEFVEIRGNANESLSGLTYLVIGDDDLAFPPEGNGTIEAVVQLSKYFIPADGTLLLAEATFTLATPNAVVNLNFEGGDNVTHLIVSGFSGSDGQDLDTNDDGVLDVTPWASVVSAIALVHDVAPDGVNADFYYATTVIGPDAGAVPSQAWQCLDAGGWRVGSADPASGSDTPGSDNPLCGSGGSPLLISEIRTGQSGNDTDEYFELTGTPGTSLAGLTYIVFGDSTTPNFNGVVECVVSLDGYSIPADGTFVAAESTFTMGTPDLVLDAAGNALNFEDSDNVTHMLVSGFTGIVMDDLDVDENCVLDSTPWIEVLDAVSIIGAAVETGCNYSNTLVGPDGNYVAGHVYRCSPAGEWRIGAFSASAGGDTPGAGNLDCSVPYVLECGQAEAGDCATIHANPFCNDSNCCSAVCAADPTCCSTAWDAECVALVAVQCAAGTASCESGPIRLNEIRVDETSTDNSEYFELSGPAGTALTGLTYIVIGDGGTTLSGTVEAVIPLTGQSIAADGFFLVAEPTMLLGTADYVPVGTNILNFENSDNVTHMLVADFTGTLNMDLDTDNNGTLDLTPWSAIVDHVAFILSNANPPISTEYAYSANHVGPDGTFAPGMIWRCQDSGCWNIGTFNPAAPVPPYAADTAGASNLACEPLPPPCPGDLDNDGLVGGSDLTALMANWAGGGVGDLDGDGLVAGGDLALMLAAWGDCPN